MFTRTFLAPALAACALFAPQAPAATIVLGGYPDKIQFIDDASGEVTERVTLETGLPESIQLSADKSKIYVMTLTTAGIEVIDAKSHKVLNRFSLNTPVTRYRFNGGVPSPDGRYFYALGQRFDKEVDLYRVSKPLYVVIDLKTQQVAREIEFAKEDEAPGWSSHLAVAPDGKSLYVFEKEIRILDTSDFSVLERIDLAKPDSPGMRNVAMRSSLETMAEPGTFVSVFNAEDPYIHNKVFGIARFNLASHEFTFDPIGPAPASMSGLAVTPDGKDGYVVSETGKLGAKRCEIWHFDLTTNAALDKAEFQCRSRYYFGMSRDGKKLYVYGAGYEIEVYDAASLQVEETWNLDNDITMAGILTTP